MSKFQYGSNYQPSKEEQERIDYVNSLDDEPIYELIANKQFNTEKLAQALMHVLIKHNLLEHSEVLSTYDFIVKRDLKNELDGYML